MSQKPNPKTILKTDTNKGPKYQTTQSGDEEEVERRLGDIFPILESVPEIELNIRSVLDRINKASVTQYSVLEEEELVKKASRLSQYAIFRRYTSLGDRDRIIRAFHEGKLASAVSKMWELKKRKVFSVNAITNSAAGEAGESSEVDYPKDKGPLGRELQTQLSDSEERYLKGVSGSRPIAYLYWYVLYALKNAVDGSELISADAESEDIVRIIMRDLARKHFQDDIDASPKISVVSLIIRAYLDILLDIIRRPGLYEKVVPVLNDIDAADILQPYVQAKHKRLKIMAVFVLSCVLEESDIERTITTPENVLYLLKVLDNALRAADHYSKQGFSLEQLLPGIRQFAASSEAAIKYLIDGGVLKQLTIILNGSLKPDDKPFTSSDEFSNFEKTTAAMTSQLISCNEYGRNRILQNINLIDALIKRSEEEGQDELEFRKTGMRKHVEERFVAGLCLVNLANHVESPKDSASGNPIAAKLIAWKNEAMRKLEDADREEAQQKKKRDQEVNIPGKERLVTKEEATPQQHVMISYCHANEKIVQLLNEELKKRGIKTWIDDEDMSGSCLDSMADGVEGASMVIVCYSQAYKNSGNCRQEAQYTFRLLKPVIPVRVQEKYKADGWLGFLLASDLYFDLSSSDKFEENFPKMFKELQTRLAKEGAAPSKANEPASPPKEKKEVPPAKPVSEAAVTPSKPAIATAARQPEPLVQAGKVSSPLLSSSAPHGAGPARPAMELKVRPSSGRSKYTAALACEKWGVEEVQIWLKKERLDYLQQLFRSLNVDGEVLGEMQAALLDAPQFLYSHLSEALRLDLVGTMKFSSKLRKLGASGGALPPIEHSKH